MCYILKQKTRSAPSGPSRRLCLACLCGTCVFPSGHLHSSLRAQWPQCDPAAGGPCWCDCPASEETGCHCLGEVHHILFQGSQGPSPLWASALLPSSHWFLLSKEFLQCLKIPNSPRVHIAAALWEVFMSMWNVIRFEFNGVGFLRSDFICVDQLLAQASCPQQSQRSGSLLPGHLSAALSVLPSPLSAVGKGEHGRRWPGSCHPC